MKLFKQPKWLKPEINTIAYWLHILGISIVVLLILQLLFGGNMFSIVNILIGVPIIGFADIINHIIWNIQ